MINYVDKLLFSYINLEGRLISISLTAFLLHEMTGHSCNEWSGGERKEGEGFHMLEGWLLLFNRIGLNSAFILIFCSWLEKLVCSDQSWTNNLRDQFFIGTPCYILWTKLFTDTVPANKNYVTVKKNYIATDPRVVQTPRYKNFVQSFKESTGAASIVELYLGLLYHSTTG